MIGIVDFGMGNVRAFANIYKNLNVPHKIVRSAEDLATVSKVILPGVGAFDYAIEQLNNSGMRDTLDELVLINKVPVLGICVGMQILANSSDEGKMSGLRWLDADVKLLDKDKLHNHQPLPHMGWNEVFSTFDNVLFDGVDKNARFYFLHSYYFKPNHSEDGIAVADYGEKFTCAVNRENIYGVQFHPEKSHQSGIQLLKNFGEL